jgi:hypothetical protein
VAATAARSSHVVVEAMTDPRTYPGRPARVDVVETHAAWVFLAGDRAYTVKKPVLLAFLDYGALERRRAMCREELRLNRRLAPRIYLGSVELVRRDGGFALVPEGEPHRDDVVDVAVEMRRFAEHDTLAARVVAQADLEHDADRIGEALAAFHLVRRAPATSAGATRAPQAAMATTLDDLAALPAGADRGAAALPARVHAQPGGRAGAAWRAWTGPRRARRPAGRARGSDRSAADRRLLGVRPDAADRGRRRRPGVPGHGTSRTWAPRAPRAGSSPRIAAPAAIPATARCSTGSPLSARSCAPRSRPYARRRAASRPSAPSTISGGSSPSPSGARGGREVR